MSETTITPRQAARYEMSKATYALRQQFDETLKAIRAYAELLSDEGDVEELVKMASSNRASWSGSFSTAENSNEHMQREAAIDQISRAERQRERLAKRAAL